MENIIEGLLQDILFELREMNSKLDRVCDKVDDVSNNIEGLKGTGLYSTITDICEKIDEVKGNGLYNSISDICDKLD